MTEAEIAAKITELNDLIEKRMKGEQAVSHNGVSVTNYSLSELIKAKQELEKSLQGTYKEHKVTFTSE